MRVYVINLRNEPLMPCGTIKARRLLKAGKAKIVNRTPFTIQLLQCGGENKQEVILGVDAGSKKIGLSAVTDKKELFSSEVQIRNDIVELLATRSQFRRTRRSRKTRYRQSRFLNRKKPIGWLAPSVENKINTHLKIIKLVNQILPITKIIVEVASFNIQKIKNPSIEGIEYQQGEQLDFWNVREYVLFRDDHKCQGRKGCKNKELSVHHIESRKIGGDAPNNLITFCTKCHDDYHKGLLKINLIRGASFRDAAFMGIMRWSLYNKLKDLYSNVSLTYGYITKNIRITNNLPKEHRTDALCITNNPLVKRLDDYFFIKQVRKHNRQIHKAKILKGGVKRLNQAPYIVHGFRLFDKVLFESSECFIYGRRVSGYFDLRTLNGDNIDVNANVKNIKLLEKRRGLLFDRRKIF